MEGVSIDDLVERYGPELRLHCYRMLGSVDDAEEILQETLLAAWRALPGFEGRSSLRTWLYRCLNARRDAARHTPSAYPDAPRRPGRTATTTLDPRPSTASSFATWRRLFGDVSSSRWPGSVPARRR